MEVKIKKLVPGAVIPDYAHPTDAGMDLVAVDREQDMYGNIVYHTGLAFEIPVGYAGFIFPRSSNCKKDIILTNCVGIIDSGYRGEVTAKFRSYDRCVEPAQYMPGERVAQMIIMPYPHVEFKEVESLSDSDRGEGGYGSTGM